MYFIAVEMSRQPYIDCSAGARRTRYDKSVAAVADRLKKNGETVASTTTTATAG